MRYLMPGKIYFQTEIIIKLLFVSLSLMLSLKEFIIANSCDFSYLILVQNVSAISISVEKKGGKTSLESKVLMLGMYRFIKYITT